VSHRQRDVALLESIVAAAADAARLIHRIYLGEFEVQRKADSTPVTVADQAAEALILDRLRAAAPGIPVIAEEEVAAGRTPAIGNEFFLVDPLDGTKEFIQRRGEFTVNIALIRDSSPVLGVVCAPVTRCLFAGGSAVESAFRASSADSLANAARTVIRVRAVPAEGLTVVSSRSHATPETEDYLAAYSIAKRVSVGSSLKFCLLANAEADLYPRLGPTMEWDTAAGHAVLVAAGGLVLAPGGGPLRYGKPGFRNSFFVASGTLVPQALPNRAASGP
jgi:3'(2'),5'-bisphosphate nucleotidase